MAMLSLVLLLAVTGEADVAASEFSVLRLVTSKLFDNDHLRKLDDLLGYRIDYLRNVRGPGRPADMLVDKKDLAYVQRFLSQKGIQNDIVVHNITQELRRERRALMGPVDGEITLDLIQKKYISYDDQTALLFQLAKRFPHMVDVWQVASSSEGRNIYAIKIGYPSNTKSQSSG